MRGCLSVIAKAVVGVFLLILVMAFFASNRDRPESGAGEDTSADWYAGGTLHEAKAPEWRRASYRNKLATAADIVAKYADSTGQRLTMDLMRRQADWMVKNLDAAFLEDNAAVNVQGVTETAAIVLLLDKEYSTFPQEEIQ